MSNKEFKSVFETPVKSINSAATGCHKIIGPPDAKKHAPAKIKKRLVLDDRLALRKRERTYDLNLVCRELPQYDPLRDEFLSDFYNTPERRRHFRKMGLVCSILIMTDR